MFQSTEQALAVAYWMFEHQPGPKSSTAMVMACASASIAASSNTCPAV